MIDTAVLEQGSQAWREARAGHATASMVGDIIKRNLNGKWSAKRANYLDALVAERMTGKPQESKEVWSLTQRLEMEPEARACYTFYTGRECETVGYIPHPVIPMSGGSPDALVGKDGILEIKCLDPKNHCKLLSGDMSVMEEYLPQMFFYLACCPARKWCDFLSYCPAMKDEELRAFIKRVPRDASAIELLEAAVKDFLAEVETRVATLSGTR